MGVATVFSMKLCTIIWNVQGLNLNNPNKRPVVKNVLKEWKGDLAFLQETKNDKMKQYIIRCLLGSPFV